MTATVPASPFLPEWAHAADHPRAGSRLVLDTADPALRGRAVTVLNWYDRVEGRSWKDAALGGDLLATTYANRCAVYGLPDTPHAVVVLLRGDRRVLVHTAELGRPPTPGLRTPMSVVLLALTLLTSCLLPGRPGTPTPPGPVPAPGGLQALEVQVAEIEGPPLLGAVVVIRDNENAGKTGTTDARGLVTLTGLIVPTGQTVCAQKEGYVESCVGVTLLQVSAHVTIRLGRVVPEPPTPPTAGVAGPLRIVGRSFVNAQGIFRPLFVTSFGTLAQLSRGDEAAAVAYMDWAKATGFNGLRFIAGNVGWLNDQRAAQARAVLPRALALAKARGLYVEATALTGTGRNPFDKAAHVRTVAQLCAAAGNCILEVGNEPWHPSQDAATKVPANLLTWGKVATVPFALGAAERDELVGGACSAGGRYPNAGGTYITIHLRRGQEWAIQIARLRELEAVSGCHGKPVMSGEPVGWGPVGSGSRLTNPSAFFAMGALCRVLELGCVGHGEHALRSLLPGPIEQRCAEAFIAGARAASEPLPAGRFATFKNGQWSDSPATGNFVFGSRGETRSTPNRVWRISSGLAGNRAAVVPIGVTGDPGVRAQAGWTLGRLIAEYPGAQVYEATK